MVCSRCVRMLEQELTKHDIPFNSIQLGEINTSKEYTDSQIIKVDRILDDLDFERITSTKSKLIETTKTAIIKLITSQTDWQNFKLSEFLAPISDYKRLTTLFSSVEGITIEKYFILQKIERAKELIIYDELNLSEIAYELGYSSSQHFSNQFKSVIGMTPSQFKKSAFHNRRSLSDI
jgi:AraC family transcriptional regulator